MRWLFSSVRATLRPLLFLTLLCLPILPLAAALGTSPHHAAASLPRTPHHASKTAHAVAALRVPASHLAPAARRPAVSVLARRIVASVLSTHSSREEAPSAGALTSARQSLRRAPPAGQVPTEGRTEQQTALALPVRSQPACSMRNGRCFLGPPLATLPTRQDGPAGSRRSQGVWPRESLLAHVRIALLQGGDAYKEAVRPCQSGAACAARLVRDSTDLRRVAPATARVRRASAVGLEANTPYAALLDAPATTPPALLSSPDALPVPPVLARAAFLYDVAAGRVLYSWNARTSLAMASTTKIMTALLALKYGHLDDWVTASYAAATIGQSSMYLQQGERLRLIDLLYGLLLPSGNDAAIAIAEHVGGSQAAFVAMMNREAAALGMTDTRYVNPYGLDAPGHATSARDLARLAVAAMQYPLFRQIVSTRYYNIAPTATNVAHDLININQPLWWYPGTIGVKPGTTGAAGRCAVEWVVRGNRTLLLVVLGDVNLVTDVRDLLNWGFDDFSRWYSPLLVPVVYAPEYFGWDGPGLWVPLANGGRYYARTGHTVQPPLLAPYVQGGAMDRYGPPTGEQFRTPSGLWAQRFTGSWLFYNPQTHRAAPYAQEVQ